MVRLVFFLLLFVSIPVFAKNSKIDHAVDIFKTDQITASILEKRYGKQFQEIAEVMLSSDGLTSAPNLNRFGKLLFDITEGINKMGSFSYLTVTPIIYPNVKTIYFSVNIVDKKDAYRLEGFLPRQTKSFSDPDQLLKKWEEYQAIGINKFFKEKTFKKITNCPAYHCIYGFNEPEFKKYKIIFNNGVTKHKNELVTILREEKDARKRAAAAFLLAHIKDGYELVNILVPSIRDSDVGVRNNVMRVLIETLRKIKEPTFPIKEIVPALNFPAEEDRNKSLYIISVLVKQPRYAAYIKKYASQDLVQNLRSIQPNIHDITYTILKAISYQHYGERDYSAWEKWSKNQIS
jgi:hypothetical protein